jgi:BASS family bile acid:Na+ symporter
MVLKHFLHQKIKNMDAWMSKLSMIGIAFIIVVITAAGRDHLLVVGLVLLAAMFLHMTIGFSLGYSVARLFRLPERDCRAIALEVGMQNGGLASGIAASMGKIATLGLAAAVNGPLMNTVFSVISSFWAKKEINE